MTLRPGYLSPNFTLAELACRCGCKTPAKVKANLILLCKEVLEPLRALLGNKPLIPTSGYRCPYWNGVVGGEPNSLHLSGNACDVIHKWHMPTVVAHEAEKIPAVAKGGLGRYTGFTHVDRRGYRARW